VVIQTRSKLCDNCREKDIIVLCIEDENICRICLKEAYRRTAYDNDDINSQLNKMVADIKKAKREGYWDQGEDFYWWNVLNNIYNDLEKEKEYEKNRRD
jgi:hypothetical protein